VSWKIVIYHDIACGWIADRCYRYRMKLDRLSELLAEASVLVDEARARKDPFAAHVYQARQQYRAAVDTSTKSGKRIEMCVQTTYIKAMALGYKGSIRDWQEVLRPGA